MGGVPELLSAIAQLLWPVTVLVVVLTFRGALRRVLRSAEHRQTEVEIGGQRLSLGQVNDQQNEMIRDLREQVAALQRQLPDAGSAADAGAVGQDAAADAARAGGAVPAPPPPGAVPEQGAVPVPGAAEPAYGGDGASAPRQALPQPAQLRGAPAYAADSRAVLWVDDQPENNALLVEQLRSNDVRVTTVSTTSEALREVQRRPYRLVVQDLGRVEGGSFQPDAGLRLLHALAELGADTPVIVFTRAYGRSAVADRACAAGAVAATSSTYELTTYFERFGLL